MSSQKIKVIIILTAAALFIVGGYVAYLYFFATKTQDTSIGGGTISGNGGVFTFDSIEPFLNEDANDPFLALTETPRLRQISATPVAGATVFVRGKEIVYRYVERATGHIFETTSESFAQIRVSNTTIPQVYNAIFVENGNGVIMQYLSEDEVIRTLYAEIVFDPESGGGSITSTFLPDNILSITVSPKGDKIFYLLRNSGVGSIGYVSNPDGSSPVEVFDSPIKEWGATWTATSRITLTSKPANGIPGVAFLVSQNQNLSEYIFSGVLGLNTLVSPDESSFLFSESIEDGTTLFGTSDGITRNPELPIVTFPNEKCVWRKTLVFCGVPVDGDLGVYPDEWYQGVGSFYDSLYVIDMESGAVAEAQNFETLGVSMDIVSPHIDFTGRYLLFTNKRDLTLWAFRLYDLAPPTSETGTATTTTNE